MLIALFSLALAQDMPKAGNIVLDISEDAEVLEVPRTQSDWIELVVRNNAKDLTSQLQGQRVRWMKEVDSWAIGGGTWILNIQVSHPEVGLEVSRDGDEVILTLEPGEPVRLKPDQPAPSVEELIGGELERDPLPRPGLPLHPFDSLAGLSLEPAEYVPAFPIWKPRLPRTMEGANLQPLLNTSWERIDLYRQVLSDRLHQINPGDQAPNSPPLSQAELEEARPILAAAYYRLATAFLSRGYHREASHYFEQLTTVEVDWPRSVIYLAQAQSAMGAGAWDKTRRHCSEAYDAGARDVQVLECLGVLSLATADPPPTQTARALIATTGRPEALMLAGQLLQRDHRHAEATPLLRRATQDLRGELRTLALINLGDALFFQGLFDDASEVWSQASADTRYSKILALRQRMRSLVVEGTSVWTSSIPDYYKIMDTPDRSGAEALYVLSQIAQTFGDLQSATQHLTRLMDRHRRLADQSDVVPLQWKNLSRRVSQLYREGRTVEMLAFFKDYYRPEVQAYVEDTTVLEQVVSTYESLGLYEDARRVQMDVFAIHNKLEIDLPRAHLDLARLYHLTKRPEEALQTLKVMERLPDAEVLQGERLLLQGTLYEELDQRVAAIVAYREALRLPAYQREALAYLTLMDERAGRCDTALPALRKLTREKLTPEQEPLPLQDGRIHTALTRCLLEFKRPLEALEAAREAVARTPDDFNRRYALYLAASAAQAAGVDEFYQDELRADEDLWAKLSEEFEADSEFIRSMQSYR